MLEHQYVFTPAQLRELFGLGRTAIYDHLADGTIPSIRIGRRYFTTREQLSLLMGGKKFGREWLADAASEADDEG